MADSNSELEVVRDLIGEGDAIGRLLVARGAFDAAYQAFRAEDATAFQTVIQRAGLQIRCHEICRWIRTKECVFRCLDLAGPPKPFERAPDPLVLAQAVARLGTDEKLAKQVADAVIKCDRKGFNDVLKRLQIQPYAHLFCHWLCTIRYRLVCRWICTVGREDPPIFWTELQSAARAVGALAEDQRTFSTVAAASSAGDALKLSDAIRTPLWLGRCHWVCEFFCSWRCVLACLTLSRSFPVAAIEGPAQIREASAFGEAVARLKENPATLSRLVAAVGTGQADGWAKLIRELKFERFALQFCHWICGWRCRRFCWLVCVDIHDNPLFDAIGDFSITTDIDPGTGLTNKAKNGTSGSHGGPKYGFFGNLSLHGFCPKRDPANPSEPMAYRFLFRPQGAAAAIPVAGGFVAPVRVGTRYAMWNGSLTPQSVWIRATGATPTPPTPTADPAPPEHVIVPDPQGWVDVDPDMWDDGIAGYLMGLASAVAIPVAPFAPGVAAGTAVPAANQKIGTDCEIVFQATRHSTIGAVNGGATPDYGNALAKAHVNNWPKVALLDLLQFHTGGATACSPLSNALDIEYTVDHELIGPWGITMVTASGMALTSPPPPPNTIRGGAGTHHENTSAWPTCSYAIRLQSQRLLTNGLQDDGGDYLEKTFCIGLRRP